ncbi:hypothetical protein P4G96_10615 [Bacillus cereus]|nr:hypothetical protein [Bacillus cereus]MEB8666268.1 hypothetical protein [Bacillus cereus]
MKQGKNPTKRDLKGMIVLEKTKRRELKQLLERIENDEMLFKFEIGEERYNNVMTDIHNILNDHALHPIVSKQLFNHLMDIYRVEQIHV